MMRPLTYVALAVTGLLMLVGIAVGGTPLVLLGILPGMALLAGGLWESWVGTVGLVVLTGAAVGAIILGAPPVLMVAGQSTGVAAWLLLGYLHRVEAADRIEHETAIQQTVLLRLGVIVAISTGMAAAIPLLTFDLPFFVALALGLVAVITLTQALRGLYQRQA